MQAKKQLSTRPSSTSSTPRRSAGSPPVRESAFSAPFLDRARRRDDAAELSESFLSRIARTAGPWEVERVPAGDGVVYAVVRRDEPAREGGGALLAFARRQEALLGAAALSALAMPNHLRLNLDKGSGRRSRLGHPIHDGARHLGHLAPALVPKVARRPEEHAGGAFLDYLHAYRCLAAATDAAALVVESLDAETLAILGRAIMRRLG